MNTNQHEYDDLDGVVKGVIGAAYEVSNVLGAGFLEKVYERAMVRELAARGVGVESQVGYPVDYKGYCVGEYVADLLVSVALLINFQRPRVEWKRIVYG